MARTYPPPADPGAARATRESALAHPVPAGMRDLLPPDAWRHADLSRRIVGTFELYGYEIVTVPLFEFADVVERGLGGASDDVLHFVEPESGAVVSLRPDMTPQVARLLATRLGDTPGPARLCYQGSVLRRRRERARRHRQIPQAGVELIGEEGPAGDLEVLSVAAAAVRAAGLDEFVIDLGHARIAGALVEPLAEGPARDILEALEVKDESEVVRRAEQHGLPARERAALAVLPSLHGGADVWPRAEKALAGTRAEAALAELRRLWDAANAASLAPNVLVDLGETRDFAYYTGPLFQVYANGPGRAIGAGGRYDGLLGRFGTPRPAVGFAFGLDDLVWALEHAGRHRELPARLLLAGASQRLAPALRAAAIVAAPAPEGDALAYARAWRYSHVVDERAGALVLVRVSDGASRPLAGDVGALVSKLRTELGSEKDTVCRQ